MGLSGVTDARCHFEEHTTPPCQRDLAHSVSLAGKGSTLFKLASSVQDDLAFMVCARSRQWWQFHAIPESTNMSGILGLWQWPPYTPPLFPYLPVHFPNSSSLLFPHISVLLPS
ncbi:hypothetical protein KIL84_016968, partial [Mauremys mutica]